MLYPVILSGGIGSRLWPVSRMAYPKPFMKINNDQSLLQNTLLRIKNIDLDIQHIYTITNQRYFDATKNEYSQLSDLDFEHHYLLEPFGKNTAPAIALSAIDIMNQFGKDAVMLVLPADHLINQYDLFSKAVSEAYDLALKNQLVTFGIKPSYAETGYGYLEIGESIHLDKSFKVRQFLEKPSFEIASEFIQKNEEKLSYLWNGGIFCFKASVFLDELSQHEPEIYKIAQNCYSLKILNKNKSIQFNPDVFKQFKDISIDYAVMEKSNKVATVACNFDWNDVGSWNAISDLNHDDYPNQVQINSHHNFVYSEHQKKMIATVGVENLVIIDTPDALLIADKQQSQDVKKVVDELKRRQHPSYELHQSEVRHWGSFTILEESHSYKIKRLVVKAGKSLSLQMHHHRSEHWVVVSGTAKVINGDSEKLIYTNESTFIPVGVKHKLSNPGVIDLVIIEVQSGEYLGEDDIIRFDLNINN